MKTAQKSLKKPREDYAGGGSDFPQEAKDAASPQKGMIDDDMGKYGGVQTKKTPEVRGQELRAGLRRRERRKFPRQKTTL